MAITIPTIYTPVHLDEVEDEESMTEETSRKMVQNSNYLLGLRPLRSIIWVQVNQNGVPPIDLSAWQIADGSEITNPNSPIRSVGATLRFTPDYRNKYPRVVPSEFAANGPAATTTASKTIQDLTYTAKDPGVNGNILTVEYIINAANIAQMVDALTLRVFFPSGATDADTIKALVDAHPIASTKYDVTVSGTGSTAQTSPVVVGNLTGGFGSNQSHNVFHDHSGITQLNDPVPLFVLEDGGNRRKHIDHFHAIAAGLSTSLFLDAPNFLKAIAYIRIV